MKFTCIAASVLALSGSLGASTLFFGGGGNLGVTSTLFTNGTISVTATGFSSNNVQVGLFGKGAAIAGSEDGLGLVNNTADEILVGTNFIQLDVSGLTGLQIAMSSTGGDSWAIFGSNTAGVKGGTQLASGGGDDSQLFAISNAFHFLDIAAVSNNVLLERLVADSGTPEPGTFGLLGLGAIGLGLIRRNNRTRT
jgi:hypothetical protein